MYLSRSVYMVAWLFQRVGLRWSLLCTNQHSIWCGVSNTWTLPKELLRAHVEETDGAENGMQNALNRFKLNFSVAYVCLSLHEYTLFMQSVYARIAFTEARGESQYIWRDPSQLDRSFLRMTEIFVHLFCWVKEPSCGVHTCRFVICLAVSSWRQLVLDTVPEQISVT